MGEDLQHTSVMLPASVLDVLKDVPAGALKVFIYLCSCNRGQPFAASIQTVAGATGIKPRSVISALNRLRKQHLVTRIKGSGNQPNHYAIPVPKRQEKAAPPKNGTTCSSPESRPARPPAATPTQAATPKNTPALESAKLGQPTATFPTPALASIPQLIALCYRPMSALEFAQLRLVYPDEVVLREKLQRFKLNCDRVEPDMKLGFFIQALKQFTQKITS
jgi:hypothetical protein